jgi:hypothetical protein
VEVVISISPCGTLVDKMVIGMTLCGWQKASVTAKGATMSRSQQEAAVGFACGS